MGSLSHWEKSFNRVGWFIPPYIQMGILGELAAEIHGSNGQFDQDKLERALVRIYEPIGLAAMVMNRYPAVPIIKDYRETIAEAIEAHFFGLSHVAVGGLVPVIEGAGRRLAQDRGLTQKSIRDVFTALAEDCKQESITKNIGATEEVISMMDSFAYFTTHFLYANSAFYPLVDKTNRHGIAHGAYTDAEYGRPINFIKAIAAIDFLAFVSSFRANVSWLGPETTPPSLKLAAYYNDLKRLSENRVR